MADRSLAVALENRLMSHGIYVTDATRLASSPGERATTGGADTDRDAGAGTESDGTPSLEEPVDDGTGIGLTYETVARAPAVTSDEVGAVVRTLLAVADERDWEPGRLEATSLTTDGDRRGRWHVEAAWFDDLGASLSETEFSRRVLETVTEA